MVIFGTQLHQALFVNIISNSNRDNLNANIIYCLNGIQEVLSPFRIIIIVGIKVISIGIRDDVNEKGLMELSPNNYHFGETFEDLLNETFRASIHVRHDTNCDQTKTNELENGEKKSFIEMQHNQTFRRKSE
jgi:hypothetical protein